MEETAFLWFRLFMLFGICPRISFLFKCTIFTRKWFDKLTMTFIICHKILLQVLYLVPCLVETGDPYFP